jgi:hypothetical protein
MHPTQQGDNRGRAMTITVFTIIGEFAVAAEDGQRLYEKIVELLPRGEHIDLDFARVRVLATPFFNAAIGRLLTEMSPEDLRRQVSFQHLPAVGQGVLSTVIENAKYHSDPAAREALDKILIDLIEEH